MSQRAIDTDRFSTALRRRLIDGDGRILISRIDGSEQVEDLAEPPNCDGLGRIRHFRRATSSGWPQNPLPIDPASRALHFDRHDMLEAEVFQIAGCNWRCWYCYVPFDRLGADERTGRWISPANLVDLYDALPRKPSVIVLSGGQPDLVPEWLPETIRELQNRNLTRACYLWTDDNLSNDYFWRYLRDDQRRLVRDYKMLGRVGCFKGYDSRSFAFNTQADPSLFDRQFEIFSRFVDFGLDMYGYVTMTSDSDDGVQELVGLFLDRLQRISPRLPLRIVPLEVREFTPLARRVSTEQFASANRVQQLAISAWNREIAERFPATERTADICDVQL